MCVLSFINILLSILYYYFYYNQVHELNMLLFEIFGIITHGRYTTLSLHYRRAIFQQFISNLVTHCFAGVPMVSVTHSFQSSVTQCFLLKVFHNHSNLVTQHYAVFCAKIFHNHSYSNALQFYRSFANKRSHSCDK